MKLTVFTFTFVSLFVGGVLGQNKVGHLTIPGFGEVDLTNPLNLSLPSFPGLNLTNLLTPNITLPSLFSNVPCVSTVSARQGICRREADCEKAHDLSDGPCALNLGVCCTKPFACGAFVIGNVSILSSPGYPQPSTKSDSCEFIVTKLPNTNQIRLDFEDFDIADADDSGRCSRDVFEIEGANPGFQPPRLCGMNKGHHLYIPVDKAGLLVPLKLRFVFSSDEIQRLFKIRVTQLDAQHPLLAPTGCLQYYIGKTGSVTSFNFEHIKQVGVKVIKGLNYGVCFRPEAGFCSVRLDPVFTRSSRAAPYYGPQQTAGQPLYAPRPVYRQFYNNPRPAYNKPRPRPQAFRPVYVNSYVPALPYPPPSSTQSPKVDLLEGKVDLLEQKKKLIEELLSGKRLALEALGKELNLPTLPSLSPLPELPALPTLSPLPGLPTLAPLPDLNQLTKDILQAKVDLLGEKTKAIDELLEKKKVTQLFIPKITAAKEVAYPTYYGQKVVPEKNSILESKINAITNLIDSKIDSKTPVAYPTYYGQKEVVVPEKNSILESKINAITNLIDSKIDSKTPVAYPTYYGQKEVVVPEKNSILESKINAITNLIDSKIDSKTPVPTPYGAKVPTKVELPTKVDVIEKVTSFIDSSKICDGKDTIGVPPNSIICADNAHPVILSTTPFTIFVDTRGDTLSRGFHFSYTQQVC